MIEVTAGLIYKNGKFLIGKRLPTKIYPNQWEFPGGKIESGESGAECLRREIKEEFDVAIKVLKPFYQWDFRYPDGKEFRFYSYWCEVIKGEPKLLAHAEICWVEKERLRDMDFLDAYRVLVEQLFHEEKKTG